MIKNASIITIGDELLIGQVVDTNSAWIASQLTALGITLQRRIAVADDATAIRAALDEELPRNELLILTGGLGPTADDITKPVLANYFDSVMVVDEKVLAHVEGIFARYNRPMLDINLRQAEVPDKCTVLFNAKGTAPGMWFERDEKVVVSLPGVPFEMMHLMETQVLPRLQGRLSNDCILHRNIITAGEGESFIADRIKDIETALPPQLHLAYLPQAGMVRLRLTGHSSDAVHLAEDIRHWSDQIAERISNIIVSREDIPMEQILGNALLKKSLRLGLAESCTGGYIAHRITQIEGASRYFQGSIVCYQNAVKETQLSVQKSTIETHDVVSEAVACEMAEGARKALASDIGFGITGLLSGEAHGTIPVGTVCMAAAREGHTVSRSFRFYHDRHRNKELATNHALLFLIRFIEALN